MFKPIPRLLRSIKRRPNREKSGIYRASYPLMVRVILLQDQPKLGEKGDIIRVRPGLMRHTLYPEKIAEYATDPMLDKHIDIVNQGYNRSFQRDYPVLARQIETKTPEAIREEYWRNVAEKRIPLPQKPPPTTSCPLQGPTFELENEREKREKFSWKESPLNEVLFYAYYRDSVKYETSNENVGGMGIPPWRNYGGLWSREQARELRLFKLPKDADDANKGKYLGHRNIFGQKPKMGEPAGEKYKHVVSRSRIVRFKGKPRNEFDDGRDYNDALLYGA
eukprot:TRINITY_DN68146_c10_g2_i1.p1 TRINITY_DN68146_c10_g2~~TRINITY_DN68146_c10_g2_i1.p1  ORF type:complete len:285 (-),score=-10.81 TRINITY_DN68146_c10_g2_i1:265-1098(-)